MPDPHSLEEPRPARSLWRTALAVLASALVLVALIAGATTWWMTHRVTAQARDVARAVAEEFRQAFQLTPEVRINSLVVVAANTPAAELMTMQKQARVRHAWSQTWMHSTKTIEVEATFTARAGFDLHEPFRVTIDPATGTVITQLPPARILSLGMSDVSVPRDEDGYWNKLTQQDREQAFRELEEEARKQFADSDQVAEASREGEIRVRALIRKAMDPGVPIVTTPAPAPR